MAAPDPESAVDPPRSSWRSLSGIPLAAAAVAIAAFLFHELSSLDVWWQVTIGRDILDTLSIPSVDRYSAAGMGRLYHDSHWLFQVVLAGFHSLGGMAAVSLVPAAFWSVALVFCYRTIRRSASPVMGAVLLFLVAMASVERFLPRPELCTIAAIAIFHDRLERRRFRTWRDIGILTLVQILWANGHGLFVIGPLMVGCHWLASAVRRARGGGSDFAAWTRVLLTVLCATIVTPFGIHGWSYALVLLQEAGPQQQGVMSTIGELSPTFGSSARSAPAFWFYAALVVLTVVTAWTSFLRRRLDAGWLVVAGLFVASALGRRNMPLFALVAAPVIARPLGELLPTAWSYGRSAVLTISALMAGWALFPLSGRYYEFMEIPCRFGVGVSPSFFPHRLPEFLEEVAFEGQVLNSNTLGGFFLYHRYPRQVPLSDGRWEVYEPDELARVLDGSRDALAWRELVARYEITGVLLGHSSPEAGAMLPSLAIRRDWRLVYVDHAASFWMPAAGPRAPAAIDLTDPARLPAIPRVDDGLILEGFLSKIGATAMRVANLERTRTLGSRREVVSERLGLALIAAERFGDARTTFESLLGERPNSVVALEELAFLAYRDGDLGGAIEYMERALEVDPENTRLRTNLESIRGRPGVDGVRDR